MPGLEVIRADLLKERSLGELPREIPAHFTRSGYVKEERNGARPPRTAQEIGDAPSVRGDIDPRREPVPPKVAANIPHIRIRLNPPSYGRRRECTRRAWQE